MSDSGIGSGDGHGWVDGLWGALGELEPGARIGQYRVERLLGRGGMGEVYEVFHEALRRSFALKTLPRRLSSLPGFVERFEREARVMSHLSHRGIVAVDDFGQTEGLYWLRMELVKGVECLGQRAVSLADMAGRNGGMVCQEALSLLLLQILGALDYAHDNKVIHRDLKPGNILLDQPFKRVRTRISDFGLVRVIGEDWLRGEASRTANAAAMSSSSLDASSVGTRALMGTYAYMSPEQKRGEPADARSDLYALGLMAFRLLTGEHDIGFRLPSQIRRELHPGWDEIVRRAVETSPEARYQSAREMREAVRMVCGSLLRPGLDGPKGRRASGAEARSLWRKAGRRVVWAAVATVGLTLAGWTAWGARAFWPPIRRPAPEAVTERNAAVVTLSAVRPGPDRISDEFASGELRRDLWFARERRGGLGGYGAGEWRASVRVVPGTGDGVLEANVSGPASSNTYWGEASVRTVHDFNDGREWLIDFEWDTVLRTDPPHGDLFAIQITDDSAPADVELRLVDETPAPGTAQLWYASKNMSPELTAKPPFTQKAWSIRVTPSGYARLYDRPAGMGRLVREVALAGLKAWHLRFILADYTSYGLPAGDNAFRIHRFDARVERVLQPIMVRARWTSMRERCEAAAPGGKRDIVVEYGVNTLGAKFVRIPAGEFEMGIDDPENRECGPTHRVVIPKAFWLSACEVTQGVYEQVMGVNPSRFRGADLPVECVSWSDARAFCERMSERERLVYRLPTEAEWEYACSAGVRAKNYWGDSLGDDCAWLPGVGEWRTHPAGAKLPNVWGLYDMIGNVEEWTNSAWRAYPYVTGDGRESAEGEAERVLRGGAWNPGTHATSYSRSWEGPGEKRPHRGFRVVVEGDDKE